MKHVNTLVLIILSVLFQNHANSIQQFSLDHPIQVLDVVAPFLPQNPVILEAGAWTGTESIAMSQRWPNAVVHAFEPLPQAYLWLVTNAKKSPNIYTYESALSDRTGLHDFYVSEVPWEPMGLWQSSSILPPHKHLEHAPWVQFNKKITVFGTTIDQWAQLHNIDHIDFMWLDLQGYELNALKASPIILKTVKAIMTEVEAVEAYKGQYLYKDIKTWLESQGFTMIAVNFDLNNPTWFGDALFVRSELIK